MNDGVVDIACIDNFHVITDVGLVGTMACNVFIDEATQRILECAVVEVLHHEGRQLAVQVAEENDVAVAHFVEYRDEIALAIGGSLGCLHGTDVADVAIVAYRVVIDVVADVFNQTVVANGHVAQCCVVDAGVFEETTAHLDVFLEVTDVDFAVEHHAMHVIGLKILAHVDIRPVFGPTALILKNTDLFVG